jgi:hypothetical protein
VPESCRIDRAGIAAFESAMDSLLLLREQDDDGLFPVEDVTHIVA